MKYLITVSEVTESKKDYRDFETRDVYRVEIEGDDSIVLAVSKAALEIMEARHTLSAEPPVVVGGSKLKGVIK